MTGDGVGGYRGLGQRRKGSASGQQRHCGCGGQSDSDTGRFHGSPFQKPSEKDEQKRPDDVNDPSAWIRVEQHAVFIVSGRLLWIWNGMDDDVDIERLSISFVIPLFNHIFGSMGIFPPRVVHHAPVLKGLKRVSTS
jgi:hypothetical protein